MRVVHAARDVAHPAHGFVVGARPDRGCRATRCEHAALGLPFADELHDDIRRIGVVDVEHAHDVIARDLGGGARFGQDLVDHRRALAAEHFDRDVAAELRVVRLPHARGRADVEQHAELVAIALERGRRFVIVEPLAVRAQPDQCLRAQLVGELGDERRPLRIGPRGDRRERFADIARIRHAIPCSMLCTSTK